MANQKDTTNERVSEHTATEAQKTQEVTSEIPQFEKDQRIVYPLQGVGVVRDIVERTFDGRKIMYYDIYLQEDDMILMVPIEKAASLGLRNIISAHDARTVLDKIGEEKILESTSDWKQRYINHMEQLRDGSILETVAVIRSLYLRSRTKDLPIMERKLYDSSYRALIEEFSLALNTTSEEMKRKLIRKFETNAPSV